MLEEDLFDIQEVFRHFGTLIIRRAEDYANKRIMLRLPIIPKKLVGLIFQKTQELFEAEPVMLDIAGPVVVVGDLHGHILDLFRILKVCHPPPLTKYLFLGDIVDRGDFSLETLILIFVMKILFPQHIYIIRGNHEFDETCERLGFLAEIQSVYGSTELYDQVLDVFSFIPLAAMIDHTKICVHGGIGPNFTSSDLVWEISRPLYDYANDIIKELLWSDPTDKFPLYFPSDRGYGSLFGNISTTNFLRSKQLTHIIRGHQCVNDGVKSQFDDQLYTVFSASNYCGTSRNLAGILIIQNGVISTKTFDPLPYLKRVDVTFVKSESEDVFRMPAKTSNLVYGSSERKLLAEKQEHSRLPLLEGQRYQSCKVVNEIIDPFAAIENRIGRPRPNAKSSFYHSNCVPPLAATPNPKPPSQKKFNNFFVPL